MNKSINIAPPQLPPSLIGLSDKPFVVGASSFNDMKMVEDLGMMYSLPTSKQKKHFAIYECPYCGSHFRAVLADMRRGDYKSCGCKKFTWMIEKTTKHGMSYTKIFRIWHGMVERCNYEKHISYANYGGRGISVCNEWKDDFIAFYKWAIGNGYVDGLTIDRIDNDGDYCPENCRIATKQQNCMNKRPRGHKLSKYKGVYIRKNRWYAVIGHNYKRINIGSFKDEVSAAMAYDKKALELFGEFACLNFPNK